MPRLNDFTIEDGVYGDEDDGNAKRLQLLQIISDLHLRRIICRMGRDREPDCFHLGLLGR